VSIKVMTLVWEVEFPQLAAKMVALKLADCASDRGDSIFPSVETIERTTGCVQSTVRKWLFAMEHCGLLKVVKRSPGGAQANTTRRAFDMDLLRRLSPTVDAAGKEVAPELKLVEVRAKRLADAPDGSPVVVPADDPREGTAVVVYAIEANAAPPGAGGAGAPPGPVDQGAGAADAVNPGSDTPTPGQPDQGVTPPPGGGVGPGHTPPFNGGVGGATPPPDGGDPSAKRRGPLRETDPNRHLTVNEPSLSPQPPRGSRRKGAREGDDLIEELKSAKPHCGRAIESLFKDLLARVRIDAPDPMHALGVLAEWAEARSDAELAEALKLLTTPGEHYRRATAKPSDIEDAIRAAIKIEKGRAAARSGPLIFRGTPEFEAMLAKVAATNPGEARYLGGLDRVRRVDVAKYFDPAHAADPRRECGSGGSAWAPQSGGSPCSPAAEAAEGRQAPKAPGAGAPIARASISEGVNRQREESAGHQHDGGPHAQ
jgi:hypothetical protein